MMLLRTGIFAPCHVHAHKHKARRWVALGGKKINVQTHWIIRLYYFDFPVSYPAFLIATEEGVSCRAFIWRASWQKMMLIHRPHHKWIRVTVASSELNDHTHICIIYFLAFFEKSMLSESSPAACLAWPALLDHFVSWTTHDIHSEGNVRHVPWEACIVGRSFIDNTFTTMLPLEPTYTMSVYNHTCD